jgi:hypothetical protein
MTGPPGGRGRGKAGRVWVVCGAMTTMLAVTQSPGVLLAAAGVAMIVALRNQGLTVRSAARRVLTRRR